MVNISVGGRPLRTSYTPCSAFACIVRIISCSLFPLAQPIQRRVPLCLSLLITSSFRFLRFLSERSSYVTRLRASTSSQALCLCAFAPRLSSGPVRISLCPLQFQIQNMTSLFKHKNFKNEFLDTNSVCLVIMTLLFKHKKFKNEFLDTNSAGTGTRTLLCQAS